MKKLLQESLIVESGSANPEDSKYVYERALVKLDDLGFSKKHRYFDILEKSYNEYKTKANEIIKKAKDYNLKFDFEVRWYAGTGSRVKDRASIQSYVSFGSNNEIRTMFYDEYVALKKQFPYGFSPDGFYAEKQKEIVSGLNLPFKVYGGEAGYTTDGNRVFLTLNFGELN